MTVELDFDWTKPDEVNQVDRLDRGKYAKFLTNYLSGYTDDSYVMNLNAEWGAGKTWFLKRWQQTIQYQHPTAYIDAWQNDFSDDPLLTVIAGISDALKAYPNVSSYQYTKKVAKTGGRFLKQAAPAFLNALMKHYTGLDSKNFKLEDFGDFAEKALEASLDDHNAKVRDIEGFKRAISDWINKAVGSRADGSPGKPMFIFIDELDRCRPTYAIELLETVKHLFDIPGLVFVIATNTDQLQHSIKAVYGQEFDAQRYLYRFFNRSFTLREPDLLSFLKTQPSFEKLKISLERSGIDGEIRTEHACLAESLAAISEGLQFDLRTCSQWLDQLDLYFASVENRDNYFWPVVAVMQAVKLKNPDFYRKLFIETKTLEEVNVEIIRINDSGMSPIARYKPQDKKLQLFTKGRRLLCGVNNNFLSESESEKERQIEVSFNLDFIGQIAGMLSDAMMEDNLTNHRYFPGKNEDKHRSLSDIRDTTAFFAIYKEQMVTKEVTKQDYLNLIDLASDLK